MPNGPNIDIKVLLESLLFNIQQVFQNKLIGLYLYGSLTAGDFDPDNSDIDLLVVTSSQITATEFNALRTMHRNFARNNPAWEDRIDAVYLPAAALMAFRSERSPIVISPGEPFHVREGEALADWLQNWYIVRESGLALFGPPPNTVIPPITQDEFVEAIRRYGTEVSGRIRHQRHRKSQVYAILTMCRVFHVHRTGKQASKRQAALWAREALPEWAPLIQSALAWRKAWRDEFVNHNATRAETMKFMKFVSDKILAESNSYRSL